MFMKLEDGAEFKTSAVEYVGPLKNPQNKQCYRIVFNNGAAEIILESFKPRDEFIKEWKKACGSTKVSLF